MLASCFYHTRYLTFCGPTRNIPLGNVMTDVKRLSNVTSCQTKERQRLSNMPFTNLIDSIKIALTDSNDFADNGVCGSKRNASRSSNGILSVSYTHLTLPTIYSV